MGKKWGVALYGLGRFCMFPVRVRQVAEHEVNFTGDSETISQTGGGVRVDF